MTLVDAHSHLFPPAWRAGTRMPEAIFDLDLIFQRQDEAGLSMTILSDSHIWFGERDLGDIASAREYNDFAADVVRAHPRRLAALASVMPWRGRAHLDEAVRAIRDLGLAGFAVPTNDRGHYIDEIPDEFWSLAEELKAPVFLHPGRDVLSPDLMAIYRLGELCGRPMDMTVTLARFLLTGGLQRHPGLSLLCAHAGGAICMIADRLDFGHELRGYGALGPWGDVELDRPPSEGVERLHLDTVTFGRRPLRLALETVGTQRLYFGTDGPPLPFPASRSRRLVEALGLAPGPLADVMGHNAIRLFRLDAGAAPDGTDTGSAPSQHGPATDAGPTRSGATADTGLAPARVGPASGDGSGGTP